MGMRTTLSRAIPQGPRTTPVTALWVKGLGGGENQSPPPTSGTKGSLSSCLWEGRGWRCWRMTHLMGLWDLALAYGTNSTQDLALSVGLVGLKNDPV